MEIDPSLQDTFRSAIVKKSAESLEPASARRPPALLAGEGRVAGPCWRLAAPRCPNRRAFPFRPPSSGSSAGAVCRAACLDAGTGGLGSPFAPNPAQSTNVTSSSGRGAEHKVERFSLGAAEGCRAAVDAAAPPGPQCSWSYRRVGAPVKEGLRAGLATCAAAARSATLPLASPSHPLGWAAFRRPHQVPHAI